MTTTLPEHTAYDTGDGTSPALIRGARRDKAYRANKRGVEILHGISSRCTPGRCAVMGPSRVGGSRRCSIRWPGSGPRPRDGEPARAPDLDDVPDRSGEAAPQRRRVRLPELQPRADADGMRECRSPHRLRGERPPRDRISRCSRPSASTASSPGPWSCPAVAAAGRARPRPRATPADRLRRQAHWRPRHPHRCHRPRRTAPDRPRATSASLTVTTTRRSPRRATGCCSSGRLRA